MVHANTDDHLGGHEVAVAIPKSKSVLLAVSLRRFFAEDLGWILYTVTRKTSDSVLFEMHVCIIRAAQFSVSS